MTPGWYVWPLKARNGPTSGPYPTMAAALAAAAA